MKDEKKSRLIPADEFPSILPKHSRFEPMDGFKMCNHINHNPPGFMVIPMGQKYIHVCPACGQESTVFNMAVTMGV